ncbi:MAG TPA: AI-2E family transporter [Anaeromyxobacteraceae bacterium]|nr:AI-2E family transporter [Anaeromyxobacteraceae bacterium]
MPRDRMPTTELVRSTAIRTATVLGIAFLAWILWHSPLALFVTAVSSLIAVALDRAVRAMERHRVPRNAGIAIVLTLWAAVSIALVVVFAIPAVGQLQQLVVSAPQLLDRLRASELYLAIERYVPAATLSSAVPERVGDVFSSAMGIATGVLGAVAGFVTVFFVTAFMLGSGRPLVSAWLGAAKPTTRARYARLAEGIYDAVSGYVTGLAVIVAIHAALATTFLGFMKIPWFLALGLMAGMSSLIPYIGVLVAGTVIVTVAFASGGLWTGLATLAYVVVYQQIENQIVSPLVYRSAIDVNPLVILVAALILGEVWGIGGAVLSVPVTAVAQIVIAEVLKFRRERQEVPVEVAEMKHMDRP